MKPKRATLVAVLLGLLVAIGALLSGGRPSSLSCVARSTVGKLEVTDFDNAWGSKSLGSASRVWDLRPANPNASVDRHQREQALEWLATLDHPGALGAEIPTVGAARLTATCDGQVEVLELYAPHGPPRLMDCTAAAERWACARIWLRDRYRGATPAARAVVEVAYASDSLKRAQ